MLEVLASTKKVSDGATHLKLMKEPLALVFSKKSKVVGPAFTAMNPRRKEKRIGF